MTAKRLRVVIGLSFVLLGRPPLAHAALGVVYIGQSAAGGDTGVSCATQHAATFFNTAGNWGAGAAQIGQDTTVHLCGTISSTLTVQGSGVASHPIRILFESGAKLSQPVCPATGCLNMNSQTFLTVDGGANGIIECTANGTNLANHVNSTGIFAQSCTSCEFKNLTVQNIYVRTSTSDTAIDQTALNAIKFSGSNVLVHDSTFHDGGWLVWDAFVNGDTGVTVYNNNIYNADHGFILAGTGSGGTFSFYGNHVHDYVAWDYSGFHHDGIHAFSGSVNDHADTFYIYNNLFDGDIGTSPTAHIYLESGGGTPWTPSTGHAYIFNNVLIATRPMNGILFVGGASMLVYNNVIVGSGPSDSTCLEFDLTSTSKIVNNVISGCNFLYDLGVYNPVSFATPATDMDYNVYVCASGNCWTWNPGRQTGTFATWQSLCGCDSHSSAVASTGLTSSGLPLAGSAAIGAGSNLTSLGIAALDADKAGTSRPPTGAWDAGAYQFAATPAAPTGLKVGVLGTAVPAH